MTESGGASTLCMPYEPRAAHVGGPLENVKVRLRDIPEMNYYCTDKPHPRGEICMRGPQVFEGYYKASKQTSQAIDKDGWLHTGDIGVFMPNGTLQIIDRKKNIFKLQQGEYVSPEKIENILGRCSYIEEIYVDGRPS